MDQESTTGRHSRTTYVLGAGTSYPYGFPLGTQLVDLIISEAASRGREVNGQVFKRFAEDLKSSAAESIDSYLSQRLDDYELDIGKQLIAEIILRYESMSDLYKYDEKSKPWYRSFFNQQDFLRDDFNDGKPLDVITFNYDRSLEFFLVKFIKARLRLKTFKEAFKILYDKFKILHVYGRLPALPEEQVVNPIFAHGETAIEYGDTSEHLLSFLSRYAIRNFQTIHEAKVQDTVVEQIKSIYKRTDRLIFMGMGYHELNMKLLQFPLDAGSGQFQYPIKTLFGTALGLGRITKTQISEQFGIDLYSCDCKSLFDEYIPLKDRIYG